MSEFLDLGFISDAIDFVLPGGGETDPEVTTETHEEQQTTVLTYLESLKIFEGKRQMSSLESGPESYEDEDFDEGSDIAQILTGGLFGRDEVTNTTTEESGWTVRDSYTQTNWDKVRYAVGIKEIGVWAYQYVESSGFVSVPYKTPKPIRSISLHTDEIIPKDFNTEIVQRWIDYWVSFNNNDQWHPIMPADDGAMAVFDTPDRIPQVIHVNSGIPQQERDDRDGYVDMDKEANLVRLKAILRRPADRPDLTPVLKSYRLRMVLRSAL
jgi:hypothetical protein